MNDDNILARGGTERDIEEHAKENGADVTAPKTKGCEHPEDYVEYLPGGKVEYCTYCGAIRYVGRAQGWVIPLAGMNAVPPPGVDKRIGKCLKCGSLFNLGEMHECSTDTVKTG